MAALHPAACVCVLATDKQLISAYEVCVLSQVLHYLSLQYVNTSLSRDIIENIWHRNFIDVYFSIVFFLPISDIYLLLIY